MRPETCERREKKPQTSSVWCSSSSYLLFILSESRPTNRPNKSKTFLHHTPFYDYLTPWVDKRPLFDFCGVFFNIFPLFCWDSLSAAETKTIKIDGTEDNCRVNRNYINSDTEELGGRNFYQNGFKKCIGIHTIHIQSTIHFSPSWYMIRPKESSKMDRL